MVDTSQTEVPRRDSWQSTGAPGAVKFCSSCGTKLDPGARFCKGCGVKIIQPGNSQVGSVGENAIPPVPEEPVYRQPPRADTSASPKPPISETHEEAQRVPRNERKTVYDGELHKCPNCGELLNSFVIVCPACGYELRGVKTSSPVNELAKRIERASSVSEKIELITNFYVPNTREDIFDFFILAVSNLEDTVYDTDDAWQAKLEQTYHKAKIAFGNSPEFDYIEKLYTKTRAKVSQRGFSTFVRKNKIACITALLIAAGVIMLAIGIIIMASVSMDENWGASYGGMMLLIIGINFLISPTWVLSEMKKKEKAAKRQDSQRKGAIVYQSMGKDASEFIHDHYEDAVEQLRALGFKNIVVRAEKKGLLDTEGAVKGISIAGNSEFSEDDEFDINSTIIVRYYSRKR